MAQIEENERVAWPRIGMYRRKFHRDMRESVMAGVRCPKDLVDHELDTKCYGIQRGHREVLMPIRQL